MEKLQLLSPHLLAQYRAAINEAVLLEGIYLLVSKRGCNADFAFYMQNSAAYSSNIEAFGVYGSVTSICAGRV